MLHLFHPALVHFAVAFIIVGGCAEVWGMLTRREPVRRWAATLVLVGLASLVPVLATGYLAANVLDVPPPTDRLLAAHERNGWILFGLLLATQFAKAWCGGRIPDRLRWIYAGSLIVAVLQAACGAWLGGRLVYGAGVGVA
jgi:uncharacterized membrane protein